MIALINFIDAKFDVFDGGFGTTYYIEHNVADFTSVSLILAIKHFIIWSIRKKKGKK
jgi:hypothetical protein